MKRSNKQMFALVVASACVVAGARTAPTVGCVTAPCIASFQSMTVTVNGSVTASAAISTLASTLVTLEFSAHSAIVVPLETAV